MKKLITILSLLLTLYIPNLWAMCECDMWVGSTTEAGLVELATDEETVTGASDAVVCTPGNITAKMAAPGAIGGTTPAAGAFTSVTMNDDSSLAAAKHLVLPLHNDTATPTLAFGDGDSGFYEISDDAIVVSIAGSRVNLWNSTHYIAGGGATRNAAIPHAVATATSSAFSFYGDLDTGIGSAGADQLSLIAGGVEGIRITEADNVATSSMRFGTAEKSADAVTLTALECSDTLITTRGWDGADDQTFTLPDADTVVGAGLKTKILMAVTDADNSFYIDTEGSTTLIYLDGTAGADGHRIWTEFPTIGESIVCHTFTLDGSSYDWACDSVNGLWADKGS